MDLHNLSPALFSTTNGYRRGRGHGSGNGKTAGRGHKGQNARSGGGVRIGFEGGQMPLTRRVPKRGFNNIFAKPLDAINVGTLDKFEADSVVDLAKLIEGGVISDSKYGIKILSGGELTKKLTVRAKAFSEGAKSKIEAAGGKAEVV